MTPGRDMDMAVARAMCVDLVPPRDCAMVTVGWRHIDSTGSTFHLDTGDCLPMPSWKELRAPACECHRGNPNNAYALHVAEFLGRRVSTEIDAVRREPLPYSTDDATALAHCVPWLAQSAHEVRIDYSPVMEGSIVAVAVRNVITGSTVRSAVGRTLATALSQVVLAVAGREPRG